MKKIAAYFIATVLLLSTLYSQNVEKNKQVQNFKDKYPGELSIRWDEVSGGPKRILGDNIFLKSNSVNKTNIQVLTEDFINENVDLLNIRNTELELENITELENKFIVSYQQFYDKIPLWNVKLKLKVSENGQVLMIKSPCYSSPNVTLQPTITSNGAKINAVAGFDVDIKNITNEELLIYPERETGKLYLCWHIKIENGINKGIMIDAQTGKKLFEYDLYRNAEIRGTVRTTTWSLPGQTGGTPDITPYYQDLKVNVTGVGSGNTNSSGYYSITVPSAGNYTVTSSLDGSHCWVTNNEGSEASYSYTASTSSDHNWTWQESDHYNEYFVFHYMNNVWHEFNDKVSGFSSNYWYTNKMEGVANDNFAPGINGEASGTWLGITSSNHYGGTIYHEYSHNVNYKANGYWLGDYMWGDGYAMDEGLADYFSCSFTNDPIAYPSRRLDTKVKYYSPGPPETEYYEAHTRGVILGGACWDLGHKSGMTLNYVNALVYEAVVNMGYEETFGDFMDEILSADDNDGNIFNGTPHDDQILDAFVNDHAIVGSVLFGNTNTDVTLIHNVDILSNVYVTSGTLTIASGITVDLNGYSIISTGGTITKQTGATINGLRATLTSMYVPRAYCGSIQTAVNYAEEFNEILLENGNFNENVTISNTDHLILSGSSIPEYTQLGNLTVNNCYDFEASELGAKHIYINYGDITLLYYLYAAGTNQAGAGLTLYYSDGIDVDNLYAEYLNTGVDSYTSEADIEWSRIEDDSYGIKSWNASNIDVDNSLFCGTATDLFAYNFSSIYATSCAYDNGVPSISSSGGSTVQSLYNENCSNLSKSASENAYFDETINGDPVESTFREINKVYFAINKKLLKDKRNKVTENNETYCADYEKVIDDFKDFIKNNPESPLSKIALGTIARSYKRIDNLRGKKDAGSMKDFLTGIINNVEYPALQQSAERLMLDYYRLAIDYSGAIKAADELMEKYKEDKDYICDVKYAKGLILSHNMNNPEAAEECFLSIVKNNPDNPLADLAKNELRILGKQVEEDNYENITKTDNSKFDVNNYPNPFNPTTKISFTLPQNGRVSLKVYDALGREVADLANDVFTAGTHEVEFDATNLASGIYFYTIRTAQWSITKKMLLIK